MAYTVGRGRDERPGQPLGCIIPREPRGEGEKLTFAVEEHQNAVLALGLFRSELLPRVSLGFRHCVPKGSRVSRLRGGDEERDTKTRATFVSTPGDFVQPFTSIKSAERKREGKTLRASAAQETRYAPPASRIDHDSGSVQSNRLGSSSSLACRKLFHRRAA